MTRGKPKSPPSAKQIAARAEFAERSRARGKVPNTEPEISIGDKVRVIATRQHPSSFLGVVTVVEETQPRRTIGIIRDGRLVKYTESQLERVGG